MSLLRVRGDPVAREFSFAGVRELFSGRVAADRPRALAGAARLAAPVFEDTGVAPERSDLTGAVLHGLYWLVANLAERDPLVVLVDDAHWLDAASARFLVYLARRLESLPVLLVVAVRGWEADERADVTESLLEAADRVVRLGTLSEAATAELLRRELGPRVDEELCRSCYEATGGNPFYLRALLAALMMEGGRPRVEAASRVRSLGVGAVGRSVLFRLSRLGDECERLAQASAVLAPGCPLRQAATLAGLERERAEVAADRLRAADLFAPERDLSFVHPIVREAVAAQLPASRRAALHASAARLLADENAAADRVAAHLMFAEPYGERWVVDALRAAAREAVARGAPEAAASYLRRALAEPPGSEERLDVLVELGRAQALLPGDFGGGALRQALELASDQARRAEIALELAWALTSVIRHWDAVVVLEQVLEGGDELDSQLVERIEALLLGSGAVYLPATEQILVRLAPRFARAKEGEVSDPVMLAALAQTGALAGLPAGEIAALARRALRDERLLAGHPPAHHAACGALSWADALEEAGRAADAGIAEAQRRGSAPFFALASTWRAGIALRAGELELAEAISERGHELAQETGSAHFTAMPYVPVLLERGRVERALEVVDSLELSGAVLDLWEGVIVLCQRGAVYTARGELERGIADMLDADRRMAEHGMHLSVLCDWVATASGALVRLGRESEARELVEHELEEARAFGAPRRLAIALSAGGLLEPGEQGLALLREAVQMVQRSPARLAYAHAVVNLGSGLWAQGQREQARQALTQGLDLARRLGALALAEHARSQLLATGARPRRDAISGPAALTPAELRTARMAADGLGNREIAQALFRSTKTVETQLSQTYAKLGISSRSDLVEALAGFQNIGVAAGKE